MLSGQRARIARLTDPFGRLAAKLRLTPNSVTLASLPLAAAAAAAIALHDWWLGFALAALAAVMDFTDGSLARLTGRTSLAGGYLDSLVDRYVDSLLLGAIIVALDNKAAWLVGFAALFGSITTSFAKARVFQDLHPPAATWRRDLAERPERYAILLTGLLAQAAVASMGRAWPVLWVMLWVLAIVSNLTVVQRIATALRILREADHAK